MTTQERLDCLMKRLDGWMDHQGAIVILEPADICLLMEQCRFKCEDELRYYVRALDERGLIRNRSNRAHISAQITIDGYCYLPRHHPERLTSTPVGAMAASHLPSSDESTLNVDGAAPGLWITSVGRNRGFVPVSTLIHSPQPA